MTTPNFLTVEVGLYHISGPALIDPDRMSAVFVVLGPRWVDIWRAAERAWRQITIQPSVIVEIERADTEEAILLIMMEMVPEPLPSPPEPTPWYTKSYPAKS